MRSNTDHVIRGCRIFPAPSPPSPRICNVTRPVSSCDIARRITALQSLRFAPAPTKTGTECIVSHTHPACSTLFKYHTHRHIINIQRQPTPPNIPDVCAHYHPSYFRRIAYEQARTHAPRVSCRTHAKIESILRSGSGAETVCVCVNK